MTPSLDKDPSILTLLDRLRERLGAAAFDIVDHWESDLCAIGIAAPANHGVLIYLSTFGCEPGLCDVELELPPQPGAVLPYQPAGSFTGLDFDSVARLTIEHLNRA